MALTLLLVTGDNWRVMLDLTVTPDQQRFVAEFAPVALVGLAKAYVRPGGRRWLPFAFYEADQPVGFAMVVSDDDRPEDVWLYHFFIDQGQQRRGVGQTAVALLVAHVAASYPDAGRICLTVHPENDAAQRLYRRAGFRPSGETADDEPVYTLPLA